MGWQRIIPEIPKLGLNESFYFTNKVTGIRLAVEWISTNGIICDLDLYILLYDERVRNNNFLSIPLSLTHTSSHSLTHIYTIFLGKIY